MAVISAFFVAASIPCLKWSLPREGYPHTNAADEWTPLQMFSLMNPKKLDFNPHYRGNGALGYYIMGTFIAAGGVLGAYPISKDKEFLRANVHYLARIYVAGRISSLVFGLGVIWLLYLLGALLWDRMTGVVAAAIGALTPGIVMNSTIMTHNITVTFFLLLTVYLATRFVHKPSVRTYFLVAVAAGLALSTKFSALTAPAALIAVLPGSHGWSPSRKAVGLLLGGLVVFVTFFVTSPYLVMDFMRGTVGEAPEIGLSAVDVLKGATVLSGMPSAPARLLGVLVVQLGLPQLLLGLGGLVIMIWQAKRRRDFWPGLFVFLSFVVVVLTVGSNYIDRTRVLLLYPALSLAAGMALVLICRRYIASRLIWVWAVFIVVFAWQLSLIGSVCAAHGGPLTQTTASRWLVEHVPPTDTLTTLSSPWYAHPDLLAYEYSLSLGRHPNEKRSTQYGFKVIESADSLVAARPKWVVLAGVREYARIMALDRAHDYRLAGEFTMPARRFNFPMSLFWRPTMLYEPHIFIFQRRNLASAP
jgi:hypothetical protein